jgi:ribosomal protein L11 methyltransferase
MEVYRQYEIDSTSEIIIALLSVLPFESFEERADTTIAYIQDKAWTADLDAEVHKICTSQQATAAMTILQPRNWNEAWESNFTPVDVGQFCSVRADFHPAAVGYDHVIHLQPKMAFGTGHHETTYMMIQTMEAMPIAGGRILDYGCGTGILAVLAAKLGADYIVAVDIEEESYLNTLENAEKNKVKINEVVHGTIDNIEGTYGIILANINRNVLLDTAADVMDRLASGGTLLMSGILSQDREVIIDRYTALALQLEDVVSRGNWLCMRWSRS